MSDEVSDGSRPVARTIARVFFTGAFLSILGAGLFAVHLINKKLVASPAQTYVPISSASRANSQAADALRSKSAKWNLYRAEAGFSVVAPASYTLTFPRPSADIYLADIRTEGRGIVRAAALGDRIGAVPYTTWARGATVLDMNALLPGHLGKVENLHADTFVAGWFDYDRQDDVGYLHCITSPALLGNIPVAVEACSTYGLEYDSALLNIALPTALSAQKSVDFINPTGEQALAQAFVEHPPEVEPPAAPLKKESGKKARSTDTVAPEAASEVTLTPAPKLAPRDAWEQTRSVHCYGKVLSEMEACYVTEAQEEIHQLQDGGEGRPSTEKTTTADDHPGVDVMPSEDDTANDSVIQKHDKNENADSQ